MGAPQLSPQDEAKRRAALKALDYVRPGMKLGLGTGSTAAWFVALLGERVAAGFETLGVPTSEATRVQAAGLNIPLSTLDETPSLDLTIDGADEFDSRLRLIKGGGGALLREKIVASASAAMIVIADSSKRVEKLGRFPLPVEVDRFGLEATRRHVAQVCAAFARPVEPALRRREGHVFVTDGGHAILDCALGAIADPDGLAAALNAIAGVVEHGLFVDLASKIIVADPQGTSEIDAG